jgi:hypothetical protein
VDGHPKSEVEYFKRRPCASVAIDLAMEEGGIMTAGFEFSPYASKWERSLTLVAGTPWSLNAAREDFALREGASPPHSG